MTSNSQALGGPTATVSQVPLCGWPTQGAGYLYLTGTLGGTTVAPAGGPLARPLSGSELEVRIAIPMGATNVSFSWGFRWLTNGGCFVGTGPPAMPRNDGLDISIVDAQGATLLNLVYADVASQPQSPCPPAIQNVNLALPALPVGAYLSIAFWDGALSPPCSANTFNEAYIDAVVFAVPANPYTLSLTSPSGPGSLQLALSNGTPNANYLTLLTLNAGNFPTGAVAGIDILPTELTTLLGFGAPPITGTLNAAGAASFGFGPVPEYRRNTQGCSRMGRRAVHA